MKIKARGLTEEEWFRQFQQLCRDNGMRVPITVEIYRMWYIDGYPPQAVVDEIHRHDTIIRQSNKWWDPTNNGFTSAFN